jgi:predicted amidohydrolase
MKRELHKSIRRQIRAFPVGSDFSQSAYDHKDMSLCEKPNQRENHRIWRSKRLMQLPLKIAALQYRYDFPENFQAYEEKITTLVKRLAGEGVQLLLFPEYAGFEIASIQNWQQQLPRYFALFQNLSCIYGMYICAGTQIVATENGTFNRSCFFSPKSGFSWQDKCILTPYEIGEGILSAGETVRLFDTEFGKVGICICYDVEFPKLVDFLVNRGAQLILVPSYTSTVHGFYRVFTSCRARALEQQCYVVQSALVGQTDVEIAYGAAAICSPIDDGFPEDGILALGVRDQPETVIATLDFSLLEKVRTGGQTRNHADAQKLNARSIRLESFDLR